MKIIKEINNLDNIWNRAENRKLLINMIFYVINNIKLNR